MGQLEIRWRNLDDLFGSMREVGEQSHEVTAYFADHVCDTSGFDYATCALKPIADVLPELSTYFNQMQQLFATRWSGVADAVAITARNIDRQDESVRIDVDRLRGEGPSALPGPRLEVEVRLFDPEPLTDLLTPPEKGESEANHNDKFDWVADAWDDAIGTINQGIGVLQDIGVSIEPLPEKGLREHIIYPLSADYEQIRANANACTILDDAMAQWGENFTLLSAKVGTALLGQTEAALVVHMNLYHLAVRGIGAGVGAGSLVFGEIADIAEKIAVEVEDVLVLLGEKVAKLGKKVGTRLIPYLGQALAVIDFLIDGTEMFRDIIADIELVRQIVEDCLALVDEVVAWAEVQAGRLKVFRQVLDAAKDLPVVGEVGLEDISTNLGHVEKTLQDVVQFADDTSDARDDLDEALGDLEQLKFDGLMIDLPEDGQLMAPGAPPYYDPDTGDMVYPGQGGGMVV